MPSLSSIFSVRNTLCFSGIVAVSVGLPMAIAPAAAVTLFLGKRASAPDADKRALDLTMRSNGIAVLSSGVQTLLATPTVRNLVGATVIEALFVVYHLGYRVSGAWKKADGRMLASTVFTPLACATFAIQSAALACGDRSDDGEDRSD